MVEVGNPAPDFELKDQHGQAVRLSAFRGRKAVAVVFYPFAFSRVCTGELSEVRDNLPGFVSDDSTVLAVSCDPMYALRVFADRDGLEFPLLSDFWPHGAVAQQYGAFDAERGCATRSTFLVDKAGMVRWSLHNPMPEARDLAEQLKVLGELAAEGGPWRPK